MTTIATTKQPKTVADKIRAFRDEFTRNYLRKHKKINIYAFTREFLRQGEGLRS